MKPYLIREIEVSDNEAVELLITKVMTEYGCVGEGYSINDSEVKDMFSSYDNDSSVFYVIESEKKIVGCGGFARLQNADSEICELRKMYFYPELRGLGFGQKLLDICLNSAKKLGYKQCYLETIERMNRAKKLYLKNGFLPLDNHLGETGHCSCDSYYLKDL